MAYAEKHPKDVAEASDISIESGGALEEEQVGGCRACARACRCDTVQVVALGLVGAAAVGSLLVAVSEDHPVAATLSAVVAWLAWYAFTVRRECSRLHARIQVSLDDNLGKGGVAVPSGTTRGAGRVLQQDGRSSDLDITSYAKSLGLIAAGGPAAAPHDGQTMEAVLLSALVNEYLRCVNILKQYQSYFGPLLDAPAIDPVFTVAESLISGLGLGSTGLEPAGAPDVFSAAMGVAPVGRPSLRWEVEERRVAEEGTARSMSTVGTVALEHESAAAARDGSGAGAAAAAAPQPGAPTAAGGGGVEVAAAGGSLHAAPDGPQPGPSPAEEEDDDDPPWLKAIRNPASRMRAAANTAVATTRAANLATQRKAEEP